MNGIKDSTGKKAKTQVNKNGVKGGRPGDFSGYQGGGNKTIMANAIAAKTAKTASTTESNRIAAKKVAISSPTYSRPQEPKFMKKGGSVKKMALGGEDNPKKVAKAAEKAAYNTYIKPAVNKMNANNQAGGPSRKKKMKHGGSTKK